MTKARKNYNLIPPAAALLLLAGVLGVMGALRVRTRSSRVFSDAVNGHRKLVETYALKERIPEEADALLAIMEIESGGRAEDVMQSSESLGLPPNTLDTEASVAQGCAYYAMLLRTAAEEGLFRPDAGPGAVRGRSGEKAEKAERAEEAEDAESPDGIPGGRQSSRLTITGSDICILRKSTAGIPGRMRSSSRSFSPGESRSLTPTRRPGRPTADGDTATGICFMRSLWKQSSGKGWRSTCRAEQH